MPSEPTTFALGLGIFLLSVSASLILTYRLKLWVGMKDAHYILAGAIITAGVATSCLLIALLPN